MAYLNVKSVHKTFPARGGGHFIALRDVNLQVEEGEFISVIGHSGCGKSTLLNLVAGLSQVSGGQIEVDGKVVSRPGPDRMVAFQNHSLLPWLTLRNNIALAVDQVHRRMPAERRKQFVEELLALVKLKPAADRLPSEVSGGMKQRCGIARALSTQPKVLLLDEPFGALDALTRANLQDELVKIWEAHRITVLMITHDVEEALLLSDRIVMMSNGPEARVAEILKVDLPRPRNRLEVIDHPSYYRQRGELLYFLNKCKRAKADTAVRPDMRRDKVAVEPQLNGQTTPSKLEKNELVIGFVPLLDCAPFAVAELEELFKEQKLKVTLSREPSWKAISDGLREGRLDAAQMVAGMPLAETLGIGGRPPFPVCTAMTLSRGGNAITFGHRLRGVGVEDRDSLRAFLKTPKAGAKPITFGIVHPASMHNLLLRAWLAGAHINPDRDVNLTVIPPPQMVANLEQGNIAGYCVGEPWNVRAVRKGLGFIAATDEDIWPAHQEKVLGVSKAWADAHPKTHLALVRALLSACATCDYSDYRRGALPKLLAERQYVGGTPEDFSACLSGPYDFGTERRESLPHLVTFSKHSANLCRTNENLWILAQMARWGLVAYPKDDRALLEEIYRESVLRCAAAEVAIDLDEQDESAIQLANSAPFDPRSPLEYLHRLTIRTEIRTVAHFTDLAGEATAAE